MKRLLILPIIVLFTIAFVQTSNANVLIEDARINSNFDGGGLTSGFIDSGSGRGGEYELITCGIDTDGPNPFNAPSPGSWNEIDNSTCSQPNCQLGIWGRFTASQSSEEITCSWGDDSLGFVAVSMRYSNVDTDNPIIDIGCSEPDGNNLIVPAVSSEPGAQLATIQLLRTPGDSPSDGDIIFDEFSATFLERVNLGNDRILTMLGTSNFDENGIGFPGVVLPIPTDIFAAKICIISLRMQPAAIPTMNEWGMLAFAAFAGIAGIWYMKRRRVNA